MYKDSSLLGIKLILAYSNIFHQANYKLQQNTDKVFTLSVGNVRIDLIDVTVLQGSYFQWG